jgi:hypothetical protein
MAHDDFSHFKFFFQLNKWAGENKNRRNTWVPQKNMKFYMEIDLGTLTKGQPYSNEN